MQDIERYGLMTLLFLVASVIAVFLWGGGTTPSETDEVAVVAPATVDVQHESRRRTSTVPISTRSADRRAGGALSPSEAMQAEREAQARERKRELQRQQEALEAAAAERESKQAEVAATIPPAQSGTRESLQQAASSRTSTPRTAAPSPQPERQVASSVPDLGAVVRPQEQTPMTRPIEVQAGDSYWKIAERELGAGHRSSLIEALNPDVDPKRLRVGQVLRVPTAAGLARQGSAPETVVAKSAPERAPSPRAEAPAVAPSGATHRVREGQSAWTIARNACGAGHRWGELAAVNPGVNLDALKVGQLLNLPSGWSADGRSTEVAVNSNSEPRQNRVR